jgi:DNA-binding GntR family transcriptional regulator
MSESAASGAAGGSSVLHVPTISEALVKSIRTMIFSGELRPGERLIEERLAQRFGVSRPPLREAMRVLAQGGIITSSPRRGFIVTPISGDDVREIYELRFVLERAAAELSLPLKDPRRLQPARDALDRMRQEAAQNDPDLMLEANSAFHSALVALPGNSRIIAAYATILEQLEMCMTINLKFRQELYKDPQDVVRRHEHLLALIEASDTDALVDAIANHGDRSFLTHLDELIGSSSEPA